MTFDEILEFVRNPKIRRIIANESGTDWQKAADIHALLEMGGGASKSAPTARQPRSVKPKPAVVVDPNGHGEI